MLASSSSPKCARRTEASQLMASMGLRLHAARQHQSALTCSRRLAAFSSAAATAARSSSSLHRQPGALCAQEGRLSWVQRTGKACVALGSSHTDSAAPVRAADSNACRLTAKGRRHWLKSHPCLCRQLCTPSPSLLFLQVAALLDTRDAALQLPQPALHALILTLRHAGSTRQG